MRSVPCTRYISNASDLYALKFWRNIRDWTFTCPCNVSVSFSCDAVCNNMKLLEQKKLRFSWNDQLNERGKKKRERLGILICLSSETKANLKMFLAKTEAVFPIVGRSCQVILPNPHLVAFGLPGNILQRKWMQKRRTSGRKKKKKEKGRELFLNRNLEQSASNKHTIFSSYVQQR